MSSEVYANGNNIACKASMDKAILPPADVCLSPPSPPAGPIPLPYPNTSFSKDMKSGSKKVKIKNKPVMLKNKSFYKSSPLGNEAATRSFGAGLVSHQITGKTYFAAWSMDVKFEGMNVDRHIDVTLTNCSNIPNGGTTNTSKPAPSSGKDEKCSCCGKDIHSNGDPMDADTWYAHRAEVEGPKAKREKKKKDPITGKNVIGSDGKVEKIEIPGKSVKEKQEEAQAQLEKARKREGCDCKKNKTKVLPEKPCDVFYSLPPKPEPVTKANQKQRANAQSAMVEAGRDVFNPKGGGGIKAKINAKRVANGKKPCQEFMHLVPLAAGGCPGTEDGGNLQCKDDLCDPCKAIDDDFKQPGNDMQTINFPETSAKL